MFREDFLRDGYIRLPDLIPAELVAEINSTLMCAIDPERPPLHLPVDEGRLHLPVRMTGPILDLQL